ncbi:uncharacterized protein J3R85_019287 [Psidium guajava]|nr:uncharacterized protein J3R85_019287 [Psidium guajava]
MVNDTATPPAFDLLSLEAVTASTDLASPALSHSVTVWGSPVLKSKTTTGNIDASRVGSSSSSSSTSVLNEAESNRIGWGSLGW